MNEEWRRIPGHPDYEVSDLGRVRSWKAIGRGGPPPRYPSGGVSRGYRHVLLRTGGARTTGFIHRLVALAFIGPRPPQQEVRHLDGDKANNRLGNLVYGTHSENGKDVGRTTGHHLGRRTHCPKGHPYDEANTYWRKRAGGGRACRACRAATANRARDEGRVKPRTRPPAARAPRAPRTHCRHGHELAPENVYLRRDGVRECRECRHRYVSEWRERHATATSATEAA